MKNMMNCSDEQLVRLFAEGSGSAFEALYERYHRQVYSYVLFLTHDVTLTDDLCQDTYIKAMQCIRDGRYGHDGRLLNWLFSVAHNVAIDFFRRRQRMNFVSNGDNDFSDIIARIELPDSSPAEAAEREELFLRLEQCVRQLPREQTDIVMRHYFDNLTFREIADADNISINTALGRMHYACRNLRKQLCSGF